MAYGGTPSADDGAIFTATYRNGIAAMEAELLSLGIETRHSRRYHPQTCGKVERFHQTLKKYLAKCDPAPSRQFLQGQLDRFTRYYNEVRPHRSLGRRTPHGPTRLATRASPVVRRSTPSDSESGVTKSTPTAP